MTALLRRSPKTSATEDSDYQIDPDMKPGKGVFRRLVSSLDPSRDSSYRRCIPLEKPVVTKDKHAACIPARIAFAAIPNRQRSQSIFLMIERKPTPKWRGRQAEEEPLPGR